MKRYSNKELTENKELGIMKYEWYTLYAGYKVCNLNKPFEPIGYITENQFLKLNTKVIKYYFNEILYKII